MTARQKTRSSSPKDATSAHSIRAACRAAESITLATGKPCVLKLRMITNTYLAGIMTSSSRNATGARRPNWTDQLREAVLWPQHKWAAAETVDIVLATQAMRGWLNDSRPYNGQHKAGWCSALADFQQSAGQLGPELRRVLGSHLRTAVSAVTSLKADFGSSANSSMPGVLGARRRLDSRRLARLSAHWELTETRVAAWEDLISACRSPAGRFEALALRRDLFWRLVQAGGQGTGQLGRMLAGVLRDNGYDVAEARVWLGDIGYSDMPRPWPPQPAGLGEAGQMGLCTRLLTQPPRRGDYVVWIAFDHAGPPDTAQKTVGRISFWDCDWVRENLRKGSGPGFDAIPSELKLTPRFLRPDDLPGDAGAGGTRDVRLVRVALGPGAWTDPVRVAAEQAEAVIAIASFEIGDSKWRPMTGYLVARDGHLWTMSSFHSQGGEPDRPNSIYQSAMDAELDTLAGRLQAHPPIANPEISEIVKAIRWWEQARLQAPLAAVMLHVRVLELLAQRVGAPPWQNYVNEYQRDWWVRETIIRQIAGVIDDALARAEQLPGPADREYVQRLGQKITTYYPGRYTRNLRQGFAALPDVARIFTPHDNIGRRAQDLVAQLTVAALPARCTSLEAEWTLLLDRLQRLRNSLAHGGPIEDESAETVQAFVEQLARWSLTDALQGLLAGKTVARANQKRRRQIRRWKSALPTAANVPRALLGPR